jgi:hypothetical protein
LKHGICFSRNSAHSEGGSAKGNSFINFLVQAGCEKYCKIDGSAQSAAANYRDGGRHNAVCGVRYMGTCCANFFQPDTGSDDAPRSAVDGAAAALRFFIVNIFKNPSTKPKATHNARVAAGHHKSSAAR